MGATIAATLVAAGGTAYAASQAPGQPAPINYAKDYRAILRAQLKNAGKLYAAHSEWDPRYQALDTQLLMQRLLGAPGGEHTETYTDYVMGPPQYKEVQVGSGMGGSNQAIRTMRVPIPGSAQMIPVQRTRQVTDPATRGLLDITENDIQPAVRRMTQEDERSRVSGENDLLKEFGAANIDAMKSANPGEAKLIDELTKQAGDELSQGGNLSADQLHVVQQAERQGQADRGMGWSPSDSFAEALKTLDAGEALKSSRRSFAANVAQLNTGTYGDPYQKFFNRSSGMAPTAGSFLNSNAGRTAPFNPESPMGQDVIGANFNAAQSNYISGQNGVNASIGAGTSTVGRLLASYINSSQTSNPGFNSTPGQQVYFNPTRQTGLQMNGSGALGY